MSATWMVVAMTIVGGIAAALQAQFAGVMNNRMGTLGSVVVIYGTGALAIGVLAAVTRDSGLTAWREVPPYTLAAGVLGLIVVGSVAFAVGRVGVVQALLTFTVSQFVFSALIDHFGWFGAEVRLFDLSRVMGIGLLFAGAWLVLR
ncbi:MAG: DMT family transporter [Acidimicrobiia bacterium]